MAPLGIPGANEEGHRKIDLGEGNVAVGVDFMNFSRSEEEHGKGGEEKRDDPTGSV